MPQPHLSDRFGCMLASRDRVGLLGNGKYTELAFASGEFYRSLPGRSLLPPSRCGGAVGVSGGGGQLLCSVCASDRIADRSHPAPSSFPMPLLRKAQQYSLGNGARDSNSMSGNACCGTTSVPQAIPALAITGCWMWCLCVVRARARPLYGTESSTFCCPSSSQ